MSNHVEIRYARQDDMVRLTLHGLTNHELREVLVGLWSRLDPDDQADHLLELAHYYEMFANPEKYPERHLSPIAQAIRAGDGSNVSIDVSKLIRQELGEDDPQ